jgi:flavin reductase (DIM6/NTAB) family NADH-FMN oxidoreductase RutF
LTLTLQRRHALEARDHITFSAEVIAVEVDGEQVE